MPTEPTNFRLDVKAKKKAYAIFAKVGIKPAQAINMFFHQVDLHKGLPFDVKIPNAETIEAMEELAKGGRKRYKNSREMYKDLGI